MTAADIEARARNLRAKIRELSLVDDPTDAQVREVQDLVGQLNRAEAQLGALAALDRSDRQAAAREAAPPDDREAPPDDREGDPDDRGAMPDDREGPPADADRMGEPHDRGNVAQFDARTPARPPAPAARAALRRAGPAPTSPDPLASGVHPAPRGMPADCREYLDLAQRARLGLYVRAGAVPGVRIGRRSAEAELRAATGLGDDATDIPWAALLSSRDLAKMRAATVAPADVGAMQHDIIGRVFARSATAFLHVDMQSVGVGEQVYEVLTAGEAADFKAAGATHSGVAGTITATTLKPKRLTARYEVRYEDLAVLRGLEDALRTDMAAAMSDELDKATLNGGADPDLAGFLHSLTNPGDRSATETWTTAVANALSGIDGKYAQDAGDLSLLVNPETLVFFEGLVQSNTAVSVATYLAGKMQGIRCSANMPVSAGANKRAAAILARRPAGNGSNAVCPVWASGVNVIRDEVTMLKEGMVGLQAVGLYNFAILQAAAYAELQFRAA